MEEESLQVHVSMKLFTEKNLGYLGKNCRVISGGLL